jgi:hypothetical protein
MQGRIGPLVLVAAVAAAVSACDLPALDDADGSADYAQVCTDAAGNAAPDSDCDYADDDYQGSTYVVGRPYMWRYYPASNLVIVPYGQRMSATGTVRRPSTASASGTGSSGGKDASGGGSRPPVISTPSAGPDGGKLTQAGSGGGIIRGGFGVKGGSNPGSGKGASSSAGS